MPTFLACFLRAGAMGDAEGAAVRGETGWHAIRITSAGWSDSARMVPAFVWDAAATVPGAGG